MTIAELFVNLSIKGGDQAAKSVSAVTRSMGGLASGALVAQAGIMAVFYGLERLMSHSASAGNALAQFSDLTGLSTKNLQQWQYAARQAGVSSEELTGSVKAVQGAMTNMLLGKGEPEGLGLLANKVGFDMSRARDTFYVMGQLQKLAKEVPADMANNIMKSFGISDGTLLAMRKQAFSMEQLSRAPTYSTGQIEQLQKVGVAWANVSAKIEMAIGKMTAKDGAKIVADISKVVDQIIRLSEELVKLSDRLRIFELIGMAFEGWGKIFNLINGGVESMMGPEEKGGKKEPLRDVINRKIDAAMDSILSLKAGAVPALAPVSNGNKNQEINVNQTLNFQHDGKDAKRTGDSVHKAVRDAVRQMSAQAQGT